MKIKDPIIKKILEDHNFPEVRGLNEYIDLFGYPLVAALKSLKAKDHWLDAGAGEGKAIREFLLASSKNDIFTTAVTLKMSSPIHHPAHKTIVNYLEDIPQEAIRSCDIITDVEGGLQYTDQLDQLLKRYTVWLKPQGKLFVALEPESTWIEKAGELLSFSDWMAGIPGFTLTPGTSEGALIIMKEPTNHSLPRLKLIETKSGEKFTRKFKEM